MREWISEQSQEIMNRSKILEEISTKIDAFIIANPSPPHVASHALSIPTGEIDDPLTSGRGVYDWLLQNCKNSARFSYRGRGRGSRKEHGDQASIPLDYSESIALYIKTSDKQQAQDRYARKLDRAFFELEDSVINSRIGKATHVLEGDILATIDRLTAEFTEGGK